MVTIVTYATDAVQANFCRSGPLTYPMKRFVLAAVLLGGTLLPVAAVAHHQPGHTGGPGGGTATLSIAAKPNPVVFGRDVSLSGRLGGQNPAGKSIKLEADPFPYGGFQTVGSATTNAQGAWALTHEPRVNTRYRASQGSTSSVILTEKVRIRVSRRVSDGTPAVGKRIRFRGRACPEHDGAEVRFQRRTSSGRWRTKRRTTLKDITGSTCSRYSKRFRVFKDGTYRVKVVSPHGDHANGISRRKRIDVH